MQVGEIEIERERVELRQIEVQTGQGKTIQVACREAGISDKSYYRYRKEYGVAC